MATHSLGTRLKAERESRGLSLVQISDSTKIPVTLLQALERNDLSRWPKAFYGRAFFRSYVTALGLDPEPLVNEFARLIPDDGSVFGAPFEPSSTDDRHTAETQPLALSWAGPSAAHRVARSVGLALLEVVAIVAIAGVIAWASPLRWFEAIGIVALVYLPAMRLAAATTRRWQFGRAPMTFPNAQAISPQLPVAAPVLNIVRMMSPVLQRTGQVVTAVFGRVASAAGHAGLVVSREVRRASSRAYAVGSHTFWRSVRSMAEQAESLARRQLNQMRD